ncbi:MAG: hypothetical protein AAGF94_20155 [Pseudomonadota bacterium]
MVRRKKPQITGEDPKYSHTFERLRPVESDMPPDVKIPGVAEEAPQPEPKPTPKPQTAETPPTPKPKATPKPAATKPQKQPAKPKAKNPTTTAISPKTAPAPAAAPKGDRQITLDAAVKREQAEAMKPLLEKGLQQRDIIMLAGRRTTEQFELSSEYVPKPDADRLPMSEGYHTSKRLDAATLDAMRDKHDPLRVRSDPAMVRGQFETLFWQVLDDVIAELRKRYS